RLHFPQNLRGFPREDRRVVKRFEQVGNKDVLVRRLRGYGLREVGTALHTRRIDDDGVAGNHLHCTRKRGIVNRVVGNVNDQLSCLRSSDHFFMTRSTPMTRPISLKDVPSLLSISIGWNFGFSALSVIPRSVR